MIRSHRRNDGTISKRGWQELLTIDRPFADVGTFITTCTQTLVKLSQARSCELRVHGVGTVVLSREGDELSIDWLSAGPEDQGVGFDKTDLVPRRSRWLEVPLIYADTTIGDLALTWEPATAPDVSPYLTDLSRQMAFMVKRYEVREWARKRLGRPLFLVGMSEAIRTLEVFVEKAAQSDLPALLYGEFGTETPYLAAAIHCCGPRRDRPFVQINCAQPRGGPDDWFRQADGGSLFFSDIDLLDAGLQTLLPQHMHSRLGQWLDVSGTARVRVIASTTADLRTLVGEQRFSRQLLAELDFLPVTVPPLRARTADIKPIIIAALEGYGYRAEEKIGPDMLEFCLTYPWPENAFEIERVVARLAVMTGRAPIRADDIRRHFPALYPGPEDRTPAMPVGIVSPPVATVSDDAGDLPQDAGKAVEDWVRHSLERDAKALASLHPGLRRALLYLVDHSHQPIRLDVLAKRVNVSQSHLSCLFRQCLQTSCKAMLARIRIEKAKTLLTQNAHQPITDVALQVGFGDLSHFERYFRRQVGRTPRDFRRAATTG